MSGEMMEREKAVACKDCGTKFKIHFLKEEVKGMILMGHCPYCQKMVEVEIDEKE